jgi:hypothetical protein
MSGATIPFVPVTMSGATIPFVPVTMSGATIGAVPLSDAMEFDAATSLLHPVAPRHAEASRPAKPIKVRAFNRSSIRFGAYANC